MTEENKNDADLAGAGEALKRAAKRAREIAERTHTPLVTYKDGHVQKRMVVRESHSPGSGTYSEIR
jgi:hypothetical protein